MKQENWIDELAKLHPVAQIAVPLIIVSGVCFLFYHWFKLLNDR